ncbi:MAG: extracellular solute-binding protein [Actinomycetota bacterium]|nr:extracellular solute-binding protein [Actinomycetota bacterium]
MRTRLLRLASGAALAALALTACGGSPTANNGGTGKQSGAAADGKAEAAYAELAGLTGKQRRDELVKRATEEGALVIYTSMTSDVADAVAEGFEDTFDLDVSVYRAGSETVLQRVLQEQKANFAGNDVVETNATELFALAKEGRLAEYKGERRDMVSDAGKFEGWTATRFNLFAPSWNTKLIGEVGGPPKSWEDLADPRFDGKLAMEVGDYDWYLTLYGHWQKQGKSESEINELFAEMAKGAKVVKGHTVQGELLSAGQFAVVASNYTYLVQQVMDKGAPVDYTPLVEPVIARPNGVGLMKTATHPAAAMLFADWLLEEGQKVLAEEGLTPSIPEGDDPLADIEVIPVDVEKLLNEDEKWSKKYEAVINGGEQVES